LAPISLARTLAAKSLFRFCQRMRYVPANPAVELSLPCYEKRLAERIVGEEDARRLVETDLERLLPFAETRTLPCRTGSADEPDMQKVLIRVLEQTSKGRVSPQDAESIASFVESFIRAKAAIEHEGRLTALEAGDDDSEEEAA
jgi:hypothetical protein